MIWYFSETREWRTAQSERTAKITRIITRIIIRHDIMNQRLDTTDSGSGPLETIKNNVCSGGMNSSRTRTSWERGKCMEEA